MTATCTILLEGLGSLELDERKLDVYDQPIGMRLLYEDPASGAEHYVIRYPGGLKAKRHRHTAAHTIIVLDGRLEADGQVVGPGAYCHFPAGVPMHHAGGDQEPCTFLILFDGPSDVEVLEG